jgi:hypothetical protein
MNYSQFLAHEETAAPAELDVPGWALSKSAGGIDASSLSVIATLKLEASQSSAGESDFINVADKHG